MALATAKLFVEEGAYVFITGRRQEQLDAAVKEIGKNVTGVQGDAGNLADLDRLYDAVKAKKGHIDILYASAGLGEFNIPLGAITEANFDNTFNVNVRGTLFTVQKALPLMRDGGSVIMTGSIASAKGFPGLSVYNASKAAIAQLPERNSGREGARSYGPLTLCWCKALQPPRSPTGTRIVQLEHGESELEPTERG